MPTSRSTTRPMVFSFVVLAAVAIAGCKKTETPATDTATTAVAPAPDTTKPAAAATPSINDAQIAHIAVTANAVDSAAGVLARTKGTSKAVKDFAQTMVTGKQVEQQQETFKNIAAAQAKAWREAADKFREAAGKVAATHTGDFDAAALTWSPRS